MVVLQNYQMNIITIHGIRRERKWYNSLASFESVKKNDINIVPFEYGYFRIYKFLWPPSRKKVIKDFCEFYSIHFPNNNKPYPNVICHSFGTYIFYSAIKKHDVIKFNKVILCGSILSPKLDFSTFFENSQISRILHDYGSQDRFVKFSFVLKYCGTSGKKGFSTQNHINLKTSGRFIERENYKDHSDYFLDKHMEENWMNFFLEKTDFSYSDAILKKHIVERIYSNYIDDNAIKVTKINFKARIDSRGNYFADYTRNGVNEKNGLLYSIDIITSADNSAQDFNSINFIAYDSENNILSVEAKEDERQHKKINIQFLHPISPNESFSLRNKFCWENSINLKTGDTDHWSIKDILNIDIALNFPDNLKRPVIFIINKRQVVEEVDVINKPQKDGSHTYYLEYENKMNNDGMIFYFEGIALKNNSNQKPMNLTRKKTNKRTLKAAEQIKLIKNSNMHSDFRYAKSSDSDIREVYKIELDVEYSNAASEETLIRRKEMFNNGFIVAKNLKQNVVGYIESTIWNEKKFDTFEEISNFPLHHEIDGDILYIIFLAVSTKFRKKGIATNLLKEVEKIARNHNLNKIQLVAKDGLVDFYSNRGFTEVKELPLFLDHTSYKSVLMEKIL